MTTLKGIHGRCERKLEVQRLLEAVGLEDVAATSNDLAVLNRGRLVFRGSPAELTAYARGSVWEVMLSPGEAADPSWRVAGSVAAAGGTRLRVLGPRPSAEASELTPTLEDGYIRLLADRAEVE